MEPVCIDAPSRASGDFGWWHQNFRGWVRPRADGEPACGGAFVANPYSAGVIEVASASGTSTRRVSPASWKSSSPTWTPDGKVVFLARAGGRRSAYIVNPDGTGLRPLYPGRKRLPDSLGSQAFAAGGLLIQGDGNGCHKLFDGAKIRRGRSDALPDHHCQSSRLGALAAGLLARSTRPAPSAETVPLGGTAPAAPLGSSSRPQGRDLGQLSGTSSATSSCSFAIAWSNVASRDSRARASWAR